LNNMALTYVKNQQWSKALQIFKSVLRSQDARFGPKSDHAIETTGMMGYIYVKLLDFEEGLTKLNIVSAWQQTNLPRSHPSVRMTRGIIKKIQKSIEEQTAVWI
jgi:hypothetical protein